MSARPPGVAVLVFNYDGQGGMERQAARLAEGLAARGSHVTVVTTFVPPGLGLGRTRRREWIRDVDVVRVPLRWWTFDGAERLYEAAAAAVLGRQRDSLDLVYAVHAKTGAHAVAVGRALGLPVLVKLACAGGHGDFASLEREPEGPRLRRLLGEADRVLCLSNELEREAVGAGLDRARFARVRNGVDLARFTSEGPRAELPELAVPLAESASRRLVLAVGRLDQQKRLDVLLRAFARVLPRVPGLRLALAGEGPLGDELEEQARALGLEGKVAFLGERADVPGLLRAAEVFVLASESEGLSNALLEALASGVPVIATAIAANRELVADGREGLLVPVGDADQLAIALERLLSDRALATRLAADGRARALEHDQGRVVEHHLEVFRAAIPSTRGRPRPFGVFALRVRALGVTGLAILRQAWRRLRGRGA